MTMKTTDIIGYCFAIKIKKGEEWGFIATCPGVGGIYEEAETQEDVIRLAVESACTIFEVRRKTGSILTEDGPFLRVLRRPSKAVRPVERLETHRNIQSHICLLSP
jgi:predicted RNase H-like HicB family nuclease